MNFFVVQLLLIFCFFQSSYSYHTNTQCTMGVGNWTGHPDFPCPNPNIETIEKCSLIIPLDCEHQSSSMDASCQGYNFKAYGLVAHLLHANIQVKWAIKAGKGHDESDFSALVNRVRPTSGPPSTETFYSSAFIVTTLWTDLAMPVIDAFGEGVNVYNLNETTDIDIRYTIKVKPFVGLLNSGDLYVIQEGYLIQAGFVAEEHYRVMTKDEANSVNDSVCVTICTEPHFHAANDGDYDPWTYSVAMRTFLNSGGNFLAQCGGIATYEVCDVNTGSEPPTHQGCPGAFLISTDGLSIKKQEFSNCNNEIVSTYPDLAYNQWQGTWQRQGGSVSIFGLYGTETAGNGVIKSQLRDKSWWSLDYISDHGGPPNADCVGHFAASAKLHADTGGQIFYLAGHDYSSVQGVRTYLNAVFVPTKRDETCNFNIGDAPGSTTGTGLPPCGCGIFRDRCGVCGGLDECVPECLDISSGASPANGAVINPTSSLTISYPASTDPDAFTYIVQMGTTFFQQNGTSFFYWDTYYQETRSLSSTFSGINPKTPFVPGQEYCYRVLVSNIGSSWNKDCAYNCFTFRNPQTTLGPHTTKDPKTTIDPAKTTKDPQTTVDPAKTTKDPATTRDPATTKDPKTTIDPARTTRAPGLTTTLPANTKNGQGADTTTQNGGGGTSKSQGGGSSASQNGGNPATTIVYPPIDFYVWFDTPGTVTTEILETYIENVFDLSTGEYTIEQIDGYWYVSIDAADNPSEKEVNSGFYGNIFPGVGFNNQAKGGHLDFDSAPTDTSGKNNNDEGLRSFAMLLQPFIANYIL